MNDIETLREAASAIRDEWEAPRGGAWAQVQAFHLAVADLERDVVEDRVAVDADVEAVDLQGIFRGRGRARHPAHCNNTTPVVKIGQVPTRR